MLEILYEDRWILAIRKPSGMLVEANPYEEAVEDLARAWVGQQSRKPYLGIPHRLDRGTSGVLLLAKRKQALKELNAQFEAHTIQKTYLALTHQKPQEEEGALAHWLVKDQAQKKALVYPKKQPQSKRVKLTYKVVATSKDACLLEVLPTTGKFHQIRAQLSAMGCPIIGDAKYGSPVERPWGTWALHAWKIRFVNSLSGEEQEVMAPPPDGFKF
jgi:23S rRNA pseudouridine1911/1915/1917 synthase